MRSKAPAFDALRHLLFLMKELLGYSVGGAILPFPIVLLSLLREQNRANLINSPVEVIGNVSLMVLVSSVSFAVVIGIPATVSRYKEIKASCIKNGIDSRDLSRMDKKERANLGFERF